MNKENVRKWVDALRSGKYQQGKTYLQTKNGYCCLGVVCRVAIADGVELEATESEFDDVVYFGGSAHFLPRQVQEWLGTDTDNVEFRDENGDRILATYANDNAARNYSFNDIANMLEETYLNGE